MNKMDVVDLDKVLDDFEFNEENSEGPKRLIRGEPNQVKNNVAFPNNNEFDFPPSGTSQNDIKHAIGDANSSNNVTGPSVSISKNIGLAYPIKSNVNVANVFTSLIEYINAGNDQTSQSMQIDILEESADITNNDEMNDLIQERPVLKLTCAVEKSGFSPDQSDNKIEESTAAVNIAENMKSLLTIVHNQVDNDEKNSSKDKPRCSSPTFADSESDDEGDEISDQDLSGSMQTSLSFTADNQGLKVIGFNSTMDDISDAELESYLQQLEVEHSNVELFNNTDSDVEIQSNSIKCSSTNEIGTMTNVEENTNTGYGLYVADSDNIVNYDSISQASTVEIIDAQNSVENIQEHQDEKQTQILNTLQDVDTNDSDICSSSNTDQSSINLPEDHIIPHPTSLSIPFTLDFQIASAGITPMNSDKNFEESVPSSTSSEEDTESSIDKPMDKNSIDEDVIDNISSNVLTEVNSQDLASSFNQKEHCEENGDKIESGLKDFPQTLESSEESIPLHQLGKIAPYWIPDHVSSTCMQCNLKFTVIKRRHHCRACGQVLCSKCCCMKAKLIYLGNTESRVCLLCFEYLTNNGEELNSSPGAVGGVIRGSDRPNPNNPMEYCSVIPPHQQVSNSVSNPISVMVPIGVLKREGSQKSRTEKTVMFSDGIRPGSDLTKLDHSWDSADAIRNADLPREGDLENQETKLET